MKKHCSLYLMLCELNGKTIAQPIPFEKKSAGKQEQLIDFAAHLQSGIYYIVLISGREEQLIKVMVAE